MAFGQDACTEGGGNVVKSQLALHTYNAEKSGLHCKEEEKTTKKFELSRHSNNVEKSRL